LRFLNEIAHVDPSIARQSARTRCFVIDQPDEL
jgi:hypothetical protein